MRKDKYLDRIIPLLKEEGLSLSMDSIADEIGEVNRGQVPFICQYQ